jgi:hypothetical protein
MPKLALFNLNLGHPLYHPQRKINLNILQLLSLQVSLFFSHPSYYPSAADYLLITEEEHISKKLPTKQFLVLLS